MTKHSVEVSEEHGVRYLHFGSEWVQSAMRVARPNALELAYTADMALFLAAAQLRVPVRRVLQVGLGAASLAKHISQTYPDATQTIIEINRQVPAVAQASFKWRPTQHTELVIADAVTWMREAALQSRGAKFDCILVDGYDQHARFGALGSKEFYADCQRQLARNGALILNLFGRSRGYSTQLKFLEEIFAGRVLALPLIEGGNSVVVAVKGAPLGLLVPDIDAALPSASMSASVRKAALARLHSTGVAVL